MATRVQGRGYVGPGGGATLVLGVFRGHCVFGCCFPLKASVGHEAAVMTAGVLGHPRPSRPDGGFSRSCSSAAVTAVISPHRHEASRSCGMLLFPCPCTLAARRPFNLLNVQKPCQRVASEALVVNLLCILSQPTPTERAFVRFTLHSTGLHPLTGECGRWLEERYDEDETVNH